MKAGLHLFVMLFALSEVAMISGCKYKNKAEQQPPDIAWGEIFQRDKGIVFTGTWSQAEVVWDKLRYTGRSKWTDAELKQWLDFQVEILEKTSTNALLENIHITAIQEFLFYPQYTQTYIKWLEGAVQTNLFSRKLVMQKARETVEMGHQQ